MRVGVRIVSSQDEAMQHIDQYGSHHSDAILTENYTNAMRFLDDVDSAAVYVNTSTQFTDGAQFGLGAEVGISTSKMHAAAPWACELTSYKWIILEMDRCACCIELNERSAPHIPRRTPSSKTVASSAASTSITRAPTSTAPSARRPTPMRSASRPSSTPPTNASS
jgi:hypothetical protein